MNVESLVLVILILLEVRQGYKMKNIEFNYGQGCFQSPTTLRIYKIDNDFIVETKGDGCIHQFILDKISAQDLKDVVNNLVQ